MRCLTKHEQSEILRSNSTGLLQSNSLSLRMTGAFDKSHKLRHPEQSEGSQTEQIIVNSGIAELMPKSKFANMSTSSQPSPQGEGENSHAELVSASLSERIDNNFPSPMEEGVGERVQLKEKINPSLKIVPFRRMLKDNFSLSLGESSSYSKVFLKKCAFTLAEVLITLGIIGVVAAITIPGLMTKYQKHVVETKLSKFNATMNQAMRLSMADNGDPDDWVERGKNYSYDERVEFMNTYFLPYMRYINVEHYDKDSNVVKITLLDGSMFTFGIDVNGGDIVYYANGKDEINQKNRFIFQFTKNNGLGNSNAVKSTNYIEPYIFQWNGDVSTLKTHERYGCRKNCTQCNYCAKLIQLNGWKIPKDYPW